MKAKFVTILETVAKWGSSFKRRYSPASSESSHRTFIELIDPIPLLSRLLVLNGSPGSLSGDRDEHLRKKAAFVDFDWESVTILLYFDVAVGKFEQYLNFIKIKFS